MYAFFLVVASDGVIYPVVLPKCFQGFVTEFPAEFIHVVVC